MDGVSVSETGFARVLYDCLRHDSGGRTLQAKPDLRGWARSNQRAETLAEEACKQYFFRKINYLETNAGLEVYLQ